MAAPEAYDLCPRLYSSRKRVVNGFGPQPAAVMVIAQNPGQKEEAFNRPLHPRGYSGRKLRDDLLPLANIDPLAVRYSNVNRCRPPKKKGGGGDETLTAKEIAACRPFLLEEIRATQPKIIITLGAPAFKWFFPDKKFSEWHGRRLEWIDVPSEFSDCESSASPDHSSISLCGERDGGGRGADHQSVFVIPMYHPAAAAPGRNPDLANTMIADWKRVTRPDAKLGQYTLVSGPEMSNILENAHVRRFGFDFETTDPMWKGTFQARRARPIGYSISVQPGMAYYTTDSIEHIRWALETEDFEVVAHNAKFECIVAAAAGITITRLHCSKLLAYVLRRESTHLKNLSWTELGIKQTRYEDVDWNDIESIVPYAAADADVTLRIFNQLEDEARAQGLWNLYDTLERPTLPFIAQMEMKGILIDPVPLTALETRLRNQLLDVDLRLEELYPYQVNWASPQQKQNVLYGPPLLRVKAKTSLKTRTHIEYLPPGLNLRVPLRTQSGDPSTGIPALRKLDHPICDTLIERGSIQKMLTGDIVHLADLRQEDGRVHTSLHQAGKWEEVSSSAGEAPETERFSSSGPNLQNLTTHGDDERPYVKEWGDEVQKAFVAPPGWYILKADIGQEEPRIGGVMSNDPQLLDDLENSDVYKIAAAIAYGVPFEEVDREKRQIGKRMFMAWLNRAGPFGIKKSAFWLSNMEAQAFINRLDTRYTEFTAWFANLVEELRDTGFVTTYFGWKCPIPGIWSTSEADRAAAMRQSVPLVIQGTGGGLLKHAIPRVGAACRPEDSALLLPVHDELLFEAAPSALARLTTACKTMVDGIMPVHFPVDIKIGKNRFEAIDEQDFFA